MSTVRERSPDLTRWLVLGAGGMLGRDVVEALAGREVRAASRADVDLRDAGAVAAAVAGADVVVNCAAWTAVDDAESHEGQAFEVNATAVAVVARACATSGAHLVHVSTDYVFAGNASEPYAESAPAAPATAYGRTKVAGEWAALAALPQRTYLLRTAWLYGRHGSSFPRTMLSLARQRDVLQVVDDQHGQPTWSRDVAERLVRLVDGGAPPGTYHATASGSTTWHGFATELFRLAGVDAVRVEPCSSAQFRRPAPRPGYSVLGHDGWASAGLPPMRRWDEALGDALDSGVFDDVLPGR